MLILLKSAFFAILSSFFGLYKKMAKDFFHFFFGSKNALYNLVPIFIGPRLKIEESIKSVSSVRPSIRPFVTAYLKNRSNNFSDFWYEVRYPYNGSIVTDPLFWKKGLGWENLNKIGKKMRFFGLLEKNAPRIFVINV